MLYHIGVLLRLNDAGLLAELDLVSSVSGGSIAAGMLAKAWRNLRFERRVLQPPQGNPRESPVEVQVATNLDAEVAAPLIALSTNTLQMQSVIAGMFPGGSSADYLANQYDKYMFKGMLLAELQKEEESAGAPGTRVAPVFIFNATSLQTGELIQFRSRAIGGLAVGWTEPGDVRLAQAVAASSAFPPFLSPLYLRPRSTRDTDWHDCDVEHFVQGTNPDLHTGRSFGVGERANYRKELHLTDGGVRDNLGLVALLQINRMRIESGRHAFDLLVSDGGRSFEPDEDPYTNWFSQTFRVLEIATNEPDLVRIDALVQEALTQEDVQQQKIQCTSGFREDSSSRSKWPKWRKTLCHKADAAYWSIERHPPRHEGYQPQPADIVEREHIRELGRISTGLKKLDETERERLINWGYLSTHYGLPFIGRLWDADREKLSVCRLPSERAGLTGDTKKDALLCPRLSVP